MLKNKVALVTGGSGYIGQEICRKLSEYGAKVYFTYNRGKEKAEVLARELNEKNPESCFALQMDCTDVKQIQKVVEELYKQESCIDILVNNAAVAQVMPLAMLEEEDLDEVYNVNIKGVLFTTRAVVRGMIRNRRGSIINMGSIAGQRLLEVPVTYALTKAAVTGMTQALAVEFKKFNIRVNTVVPGMMEDGVARGIPEEQREDFLKHCARGRAGTALDVAECVCFLASDRADYINGQHISIDGGI
jgi:NAD(P)-dependent dehydrogenase (short-subunit alcohol dehydrogenase family)